MSVSNQPPGNVTENTDSGPQIRCTKLQMSNGETSPSSLCPPLYEGTQVRESVNINDTPLFEDCLPHPYSRCKRRIQVSFYSPSRSFRSISPRLLKSRMNALLRSPAKPILRARKYCRQGWCTTQPPYPLSPVSHRPGTPLSCHVQYPTQSRLPPRSAGCYCPRPPCTDPR